MYYYTVKKNNNQSINNDNYVNLLVNPMYIILTFCWFWMNSQYVAIKYNVNKVHILILSLDLA